MKHAQNLKNGQSVGTLFPLQHMLSRYHDSGLQDLALNSCQALKQQPLTWRGACVCGCVGVCAFNQNNICFLHSFPAAINCWLSWVFDNGPGEKGGRKDSFRNGAQANVEPNGILHISWEITSTRHACIAALKFAVGDVYRPRRESVPPSQIVGKRRGEDERRLVRLSLINMPQTENNFFLDFWQLGMVLGCSKKFNK